MNYFIKIIIFWLCLINFSNAAELPIDLTALDFYLHRGFSNQWITSSQINNPDWHYIPAFETGKRPIRINELFKGQQGIPEHRFLSMKNYPAQHFTMITTFTLTEPQINSAQILGLYLQCIEPNFEIYINGHLLKQEIYLSKNGYISKNRRIKNFTLAFPSQFLKPGENILALHLIGDPSACLGLYYSKQYYIDYYDKISKTHSETLTLSFIVLYLFIGCYHLLLFHKRTSEKYNAYFGLASISLSIYLFSRTRLSCDWISNTSINSRVEFISLFMLIPFLFNFIELLINKKRSNFSTCYLSISAAFCLFTVLSPSLRFLDDLLYIWQYMSFFIFNIMVIFIGRHFFITLKAQFIIQPHNPLFFRLIRSLSRTLSRTIQGNLFIGFFLLYLCAIWDLLDSLYWNTGVFLTTYAFLALIIGIMFMLSNKFLYVHTKLERLNKELAVEINEHKKAKELAEIANLAKTRFLNTMSHELRSPLHVIGGLNETLLKNPLLRNMPGIDSTLNIIKKSIQNLSSIILDILAVQEIEKKPTPFLSNFMLEETAQGLQGLFEEKKGAKPIIFTMKFIINSKQIVRSDKDRLIQSLEKLLLNAISFTHQGEITLTIDQTQTDLIFSLADTGIGIAPDQLGIIFDPFIQLDQNFTRRVKGAGLGLTICKNNIEALNGSIEVISELNKGSVFMIRIPYQPININDQLQITNKNDGNILKKHKILYCDDDPFNLTFIEMILSDKSEYVGVNNGKSAIEYCKTTHFDLILMDIQMPEMNGIQALKEIRKINQYDKIPIVALTAQAMPGDRDLFLAEGFDAYVAKPCSEAELLSFLQEILKNHPTATNS